MDIKIKYFTDIEPLENIDQGDWIDLRAAEDINLLGDRHKMIPLGVGMKLPKGYEAHIVMRSSTFKRYGLVQTNAIGVVDESYCGDNDQWFLTAFVLKFTTRRILKNTRLAQFRIIRKQPTVNFKIVTELLDKDRGGFGSTGL